MGLVYDDEVERIDRLQHGRALWAAGQLAVSKEYARARECLRVQAPFARFDAEECVKFGLPLAQQRLGHNEEHPTHALRHQLRNDQARLDGLSEPHLVGKDAPPFRDTSQREHDCIDLMWIRIDAALALARGI